MKTKIITNVFLLCLILFSFACTHQKGKIYNEKQTNQLNDKFQIESTLPSDKKWKLVWHDEFDGNTLDTTKWNYRLNYWGYKSPTFTKEGVELDGNGHLRINLVRKGDDFLSGHLQTGSNTFDMPRDPDSKGIWPFGTKQPARFMHRFGYYEIRCKLPKNEGWHAAFWLQSPSIGAHPDPRYSGVECDIMENHSLHTKGKMVCGCIWGGYGKEYKWKGFLYPQEETADGWHTYGVDWSPEGYAFYADGKLIGKKMAPECPVSEVEQFILVSTECHGYREGLESKAPEEEWSGKPVPALFKAVLPDCFEVDYVRVYDEIPD
jgi:beta-glucanase (GH16 family)